MEVRSSLQDVLARLYAFMPLRLATRSSRERQRTRRRRESSMEMRSSLQNIFASLNTLLPLQTLLGGAVRTYVFCM